MCDYTRRTAYDKLLVSGFEIVLRIVYLDYIKRTHDVCKKYEYWREETPVEEI